MKKRWRQVVALLAATTMCAGIFAGCGGSSEEKAASDSSSETETKSETQESSGEEASSDELITLNFPCIWVGTDSKAEVFGQMVEGFNEEYAGKYEVKIEEQTDYNAYQDKVRTLVSTGSAPDIFTCGTLADVELFSQSGKLMDLTDYLAGKSDEFQAGVVEDAEVDGANYAMPYEMAVIPIMYNSKLLEEAGAEVPTSYDELWEVCDKLQANGIYPTGQMTKDNGWFSMLWYSYAVAACGGPDVYENGLDDPAFVEAAEIIKKMFDYTSPDAVGADATVVNGHFFNEREAIYTNGTWILGRIKSEGVEGLYDNLVIGNGLSYNGENSGAFIDTIQAYICAGKQDDPAKQAAVEAFFDYITDADRVTELANSSGSLFAVNIDSSKITDPIQSAIIEKLNDSAFLIEHFQSAVSTEVNNAFAPALESLVLGDYTPEEFVDALKAAEQ